ncbi:segregation and condensation protein A [Eisenibacter elegans]|uniref:segregation and condensation protein A n=1 Tax=Eisenibacter elegans TaxID=997 RepID=UPI0003FEC04D|nr:segregation/condensation protein A [Eisenibacter elegans]
MDFEIKLPLFEGPFDLLLFFIERDELDIYDIPIAKITRDFVGYTQQLERLNMDVAGEFIVVAASLMRIKAKMLLPREEGATPEEDPRQELVQYLLEYKKYKSVLPLFEQLEEERNQKESRGNLMDELAVVSSQNEVEFELNNLDLYRLMKVYERVLNRFEERIDHVPHTVVPYPYTVSGQKEYLSTKLRQQKRLNFSQIIRDYPDNPKLAVIFNFLAILEMLQNQVIDIHLEEEANDFWIEYLEEQPSYEA